MNVYTVSNEYSLGKELKSKQIISGHSVPVIFNQSILYEQTQTYEILYENLVLLPHRYNCNHGFSGLLTR